MYLPVIVLSALWVQIAGECRLPKEWRGRWYQSGLGEVVIQDYTISRKGICREHHRDYYLVENSDERCFQCLLIMQRHANIIQYKESYCLDGESLHDICAQIRVEAILYTLVREPSVPVRCPFQDAYHFSYNNNTGGFCTQPMSYVKACASDAKFRFQFEHCTNAAYTYNKDVDFECLATWKDGSDMYMYGGFSGPGINDKDDIYRCFMYTVLGTVVYLSMSADATCRGLRSSRDGPLVMELTKDVFGWPTPLCTFPQWFTMTSWQDLSAKHLYIAGNHDQTVTMYYRHNTNSIPHARRTYRCMHTRDEHNFAYSFTALSYSSHNCDSTYQCIRVYRKFHDIVEIHRGAFVNYDTNECQERHLQNASVHLLIPRSLQGKPCPFTGRYYIHPDSTGCSVDLRSGCNKTNQIDIVSSCVAQPVGQMECLESWEENDKQYIIARRLGDPAAAANCFSFRTIGDTIEFSTDAACNRGAPEIFRDGIKYTMNAKPVDCAYRAQVVPPREKSLSQQDESYDRGYKHTGSGGSMDYYDTHDDTSGHLRSDGETLTHSWHFWLALVLGVLQAIYRR